jgi:hypothetical protein
MLTSVSGPWTILAANTTMATQSSTFFTVRANADSSKWALDCLMALAANFHDGAIFAHCLSFTVDAVFL